MTTKQEDKIHYEFGGPVGAFFVVISLPVVISGLYLICNENTCLNNPFDFDWALWYQSLPSLDKYFSWEATFMYLGWMAFHVLLERILPGENVEGVVLPDKTRLSYTMSGHLQFWITFLLMGHAYPLITSLSVCTSSWTEALPKEFNTVYSLHGFAALPISMIYDAYLPLITISVIFCFLFSLYL